MVKAPFQAQGRLVIADAVKSRSPRVIVPAHWHLPHDEAASRGKKRSRQQQPKQKQKQHRPLRKQPQTEG
jgi:hypothetical protein